jgi:amidase
MKRRTFFKTTALTGSVMAVKGLSGCRSTVADKNSQELVVPDFELNEISVNELRQKMEAGELTSQEICRKYLDRIEQVDPVLKSVIELNPDALQIAAQLDQQRRNGNVRGPLHGIPVMIKDNIDSGDKMKTTAGSLALEDNIAEKDAFIVEKLREAGAVLLGKTNLSEWANFRARGSSSGWSGRGGQTRNPYYLDRNPCGSSSGSGVAVSANLCMLTIGTETNGSIVCPSGINGVVGIKPTIGLWSRRGIIPIAHSQDTAGPMARTVTDAAILLGALAAYDENDADNYPENREIYNDYTPFLQTDLNGMRIGVMPELRGFHRNVMPLFNQAKEVFKSKGVEVVEEITFEHRGNWGGPSWEVLLYEFKAGINSYLATHKTSLKNLEELIEFNKLHADKEMPWFGQEVFEMAQEKGDLNTPEYLQAKRDMRRFAGKEGIDAVMDKHRLDAIIAPTNGPAWSIDWVNGDNSGGGSASPAAISGYPAITLPMGNIHGLPIGLSVFGRAWSEPVLLKIAYAFEQATGHRKAPRFLKSLMA